MTSEAREKFHGVPRIIDRKFIEILRKTSEHKDPTKTGAVVPNALDNLMPTFSSDSFDYKTSDTLNEEQEKIFAKMYLQQHRININVRQVF